MHYSYNGSNDGRKALRSLSRFLTLFPKISTVNTAYSAIGYSAKSVIVSILGWTRFSYTNKYRI